MCEWVNTCYKLKREKKQICNLIDRIRTTRTRSKPSTAGSCLFLLPELVSLFVLWLLVRCDGDTNEEYLLLIGEVGDVSAFEPRWLRSRGLVSMQLAAKTNLISVTNLEASTRELDNCDTHVFHNVVSHTYTLSSAVHDVGMKPPANRTGSHVIVLVRGVKHDWARRTGSSSFGSETLLCSMAYYRKDFDTVSSKHETT